MLHASLQDLPVTLEDDELFALAAYTYDHGAGQDGNIYFELNKRLRSRKTLDRNVMFAIWGGFLYYLLNGLAKLPDDQAVVYRGYPDKAKTLAQYKVGRPIQWGAFSSASLDPEVTKQFTSKADGVIFKL